MLTECRTTACASKRAPAGCTHFPDVQPIVQRVLEGAHLHLSNQLFLQADSTSKGSQRTANNTEQFSNINTEQSENCKQHRAVRELQTTLSNSQTSTQSSQRTANNTEQFSNIDTEQSENCKQHRAVRELQTTLSNSQTSTQSSQRTANNTEQSENCKHQHREVRELPTCKQHREVRELPTCKQHREVREQQATLSRELQTTPQSSLGAHLFSSLSCQCENRHGNRHESSHEDRHI